MIIDSKQRIIRWKSLLEKNNLKQLHKEMSSSPPIEIADFLGKEVEATRLRIFLLFDKQLQAMILSHLEDQQRQEVGLVISSKELASILVNMESDMRIDYYQCLPKGKQKQLIYFLPDQVSSDLVKLSSYPIDTAGGIMSTDYVTISLKMSVRQALSRIREYATDKMEIYYIYILNEVKKMVGIVSLKNLVLSDPNEKVSNLMLKTFVSVKTDDDRELVARKIEKYDLVAIPVLNKDEQLAGIVSYDDAMDVIRAEQTEDMERFMGIISEDRTTYLETSSLSHFKKRISWIIGLFIVSFLSAIVMHHYQSVLGKLSILLLYLPTINDSGGNAGSQAATVVIRALSLGQVSIRNWLEILWKEIKVALLFTCILFFLGFLKVLLFSGSFSELFFGQHEFAIPDQGLYMLALVIALALCLQVLVATILGASLPLLVFWLGGDPALVASPMITTLVDVTGLFIYFNLAMYLLSSTN